MWPLAGSSDNPVCTGRADSGDAASGADERRTVDSSRVGERSIVPDWPDDKTDMPGCRLSTALLLAALTGGSAFAPAVRGRRSPRLQAATTAAPLSSAEKVPDTVSDDAPLRVLIAGAGVGGLVLADALGQHERMDVTVLESTREFKRFGGPIQLASNAVETIREIDEELCERIENMATFTGNLTNGIKDGVRDEWYAKFDLATPAKTRNMQYTCVIERPDLQELCLEACQSVGAKVQNGARVKSYEETENGVEVLLESGETIVGDVLLGADGIWSNVRATMRDEPARGEGSGVAYSGYVVYAGELDYAAPDNGEVGYKVYIGPNQYFVITDIGRGRYQWYAFLAQPPGQSEGIPEGGSVKHLRSLFHEWSPDIHDILKATQEHEIECRDLYDRPPTVRVGENAWGKGRVGLLGDAVHAMMPNLGQGGCQAIEDAKVITEELLKLQDRKHAHVEAALQEYTNRRLLRSATVQGLSRFASDIIIQGFDTPAKIVDGRLENFNYNGVVTRLMQPILPVFFSIQFNFLYSGWRNTPYNLEPIRDLFILGPSVLLSGIALDAIAGGGLLEGALGSAGTVTDTIISSGGADAVEEVVEEAVASGAASGILEGLGSVVEKRPFF